MPYFIYTFIHSLGLLLAFTFFFQGFIFFRAVLGFAEKLRKRYRELQEGKSVSSPMDHILTHQNAASFFKTKDEPTIFVQSP